MFSQRFVTAVALGPLAFSLLWWGGEILFYLALVIVSGICLYEYYRISFCYHKLMQYWGIAAGVLPVLAVVFFQSQASIVYALIIGLFLAVILFLATYDTWNNPAKFLGLFGLGIFYVGLCLAHVGLVYQLHLGRQWLFFLLIVIFSGDSGAYYVGKKIGKRKLCPKVSKGKTVAGAVGGLAANIIAAFILWFLLFRQVNLIFLIGLALFIGMVGQIGDLTESIIKRSAGVKDSGRLLPGHGGIFDRIDAVIMAAPFFYSAVALSQKVGLLPV